MSDEISVHALAQRLMGEGGVLVLDVREPDEHATASLPDAMHIPMQDVPQRLAELPADRDIAVLCHSGRRSGIIVRFLRANGFPRAINVAGGIDAWSLHVDPSVPRY